jgi:hypothetical protein
MNINAHEFKTVHPADILLGLLKTLLEELGAGLPHHGFFGPNEKFN